ncbi:hypothetical protein [Flavicella sp.]|uniref:hypothetical protein n=1 Tax=Flavicella sp. TaxID=2957742 RepID=UPI003015EAA3
MATENEIAIEALTLQALETKNDILKADKIIQIKEVFADEIIQWAKKNDAVTFESIVHLASSFAFREGKVPKGFDYLVGIAELWNSELSATEIDVVNLINISRLVVLNSPSLVSFGYLGNCVKMRQMDIYNNKLANLSGLAKLTSLVKLIAYINNFSTTAVDDILRNLVIANINTTLTEVRLQHNAVPTGGITNPDYLTLISQGVTVTIDS